MRIGSLSDLRRTGFRRQPFVSSAIVLGPELVVNGSPMAATGWTVNGADATHIATFSGGKLRYQSDTTSPQLSVFQLIATVGKTYQLSVVVSSYTSGTVKMETRSPSIILPAAIGTYTYQFTAFATQVNVTRNSANVDLTIDSISFREILN